MTPICMLVLYYYKNSYTMVVLLFSMIEFVEEREGVIYLLARCPARQ